MLEYLRDRYGSGADLVGQELIGGINRVNYNQGNTEVNALAGGWWVGRWVGGGM